MPPELALISEVRLKFVTTHAVLETFLKLELHVTMVLQKKIDYESARKGSALCQSLSREYLYVALKYPTLSATVQSFGVNRHI